MKSKLTAIILTKNEEGNIVESLNGLNFCDDVIVVDDDSSDNTRQLAKEHGAKVYKRNMQKNFGEQSNFGMEKANGDWIFFIDADERVTDELKKEILKSIYEPRGVRGFYLKRKDRFWGKWLNYGETSKFRDLRLVKKGSGKWRRRVHPYFEIKGKTGELKHPLLHYPHPNVAAITTSLNRWSDWHAAANEEEGKRSTILKVLFFPPLKFVRNYIILLGFLDGIHGYLMAMFMSYHSFLSWGKLWLLQNKKK